MYSGRSFGRQVTSISVMVLENAAAAGLHSLALFFVDEMQRYADMNHVIFVDAQEIRVQNDPLRRMALQVLDNRKFLLLAHVQGNDVGKKASLSEA